MTSVVYIVEHTDVQKNIKHDKRYYTNTPWTAKQVMEEFAFEELNALNDQYDIKEPQVKPVYELNKIPPERPIYAVIYTDPTPQPKGLKIVYVEADGLIWNGKTRDISTYKLNVFKQYKSEIKTIKNVANSNIAIDKQDHDPEIEEPTKLNYQDPADIFKAQLQSKARNLQSVIKSKRTEQSSDE